MTEQEKYINALNGLKNADIKIDDEIRYPSIKALEKQIAKKFHNYYCPICRYYFEDGESHKYCPECGQRLGE